MGFLRLIIIYIKKNYIENNQELWSLTKANKK